MRLPSTVCLISAVTIILLGQPAIFPAVALRAQTADTDAGKTYVEAQQLESILGREIRTKEEDAGRIIDLLADRTGHVRAAVVELGGFLGIGTRKIAVEWSALRFDTSGKQPIVILEMSREQLRLAPEYKSGEPIVVRKAED
jgi:hypothetical protein